MEDRNLSMQLCCQVMARCAKCVLPFNPLIKFTVLDCVLHLSAGCYSHHADLLRVQPTAWCVSFVCRLSFPSGHSSMSAYCAIFFVVR